MQNTDCTEMESIHLKKDSYNFCDKVICHGLYSSNLLKQIFFLFQRSQLMINGAYETKAVFKASILSQLTILFLHAPNSFKDRSREGET